MIGGVVVAWTQYAPMSSNLVTSQYVVQLVPHNVKGYVKKVAAKANEPLKKGDLLLEIDPAHYQYTVDQIDAQLKSATANVKHALANLEASHANAKRAADAVQHTGRSQSGRRCSEKCARKSRKMDSSLRFGQHRGSDRRQLSESGRWRDQRTKGRPKPNKELENKRQPFNRHKPASLRLRLPINKQSPVLQKLVRAYCKRTPR
jgi:multidrug resistance efflux pump